MLLVVLIWGVNYSVMKGAFTHIPPLAFTAIRFTVASLLFLPLVRRPAGASPLTGPVVWRLIGIGVVGNTLYQLSFILGLYRTTATNAAMLLAAMPVFVAAMAMSLGFDEVKPRMLWGIGVAMIGVLLVVAMRGVDFSTATIIGDLLALLAAFLWAAYTVALRTLPDDISPLRVTAIATLTGTPGLLIAGLPDLLRLDWGAIAPAGWIALAYATVFSLVLAYVLWNRSVQLAGPSRTAIYTCLSPLVASASAWVLLGERPHPLQGVGAAFIIGGVILTRR